MSENKTNKIVSIALIVIILVACVLVFALPPLLTEKFDEELIVYNWADYIDMTVLDGFAEYYKELTGKSIKVVYSNFDTNETMLTEIIKGDSNIDMICPSEYAIQKLLMNNALQKADWSYVTDLGEKDYRGNINPQIRERIDSVFVNMDTGKDVVNMNDYFVPYMWGTVGILYNSEVISREQMEEAGWGIFWNVTNIPEIEGKILVKDSIRDTYICAVMYLKEYNLLPEKFVQMSAEELINCTDHELVELAEDVLQDQRKHLKGYEVDFGKDDMVTGVANVDLAWSGDAMYAIEEATDDEGYSYLDYYVPSIGSNVWFDGWVIPKNAKNPRAATIFMNYLCRADIAMYNMLEIGYPSAVNVDIYNELSEVYDADFAPDAIDALLECYEIDASDDEAVAEFKQEYFGDERRYPEITQDLGMMQDFGKENERIVEMWERIKAFGEKDNWSLLGIIIGIIAGVLIIIVGYVVFKFNYRPKARKVTSYNPR